MVSTLHLDYRYLAANENQLDGLLRGENVETRVAVDLLAAAPLGVGETGILIARRPHSQEPARPLAIVPRDEDVRRLCGRYAQLRPDLSPLTAWCHLLAPGLLRSLDGIVREPSFRGTEAAWSGLAVAEAKLLARKPVASIRIAACLASTTYAIARTKGLWQDCLIKTIVERFDVANQLCRGKNGSHRNTSHTTRVRSSFVPLWTCLSALTADATDGSCEGTQPLVMALKALREARFRNDPDEAQSLVRPLLGTVPEAGSLVHLAEMTPESRLRVFDELVGAFRRNTTKTLLRHNALAIVAAYLATVAAGGAASLALVDDYADEWPELTGWAYLVGSIGERITWSSGFDGLGRLIAREFQRSLRLDEPPTCDFALDEAVVLADNQLRDPLVHLRIKQARVLSVALYPGVNVAVPIVETAARESASQSQPAPTPGLSELPTGAGSFLESLAGALWPYIRPLVIEETGRRSRADERERKGRRRKGPDSKLPLSSQKK